MEGGYLLSVLDTCFTGHGRAGAELLAGKRFAVRVLLVDDEEMVIDIGAQMIEKMGYDVLFTRKGDEALSLYGSHRKSIDLVVLDLIMPGLSGLETLAAVKAIRPDIEVLLVVFILGVTVGADREQECDGHRERRSGIR